MKIAVVINDLTIRGGTHKQVLRLCQYLDMKGQDYCIYTRLYEPEKTYPGFNNLKVYSLNVKNVYHGTGSIVKKFIYRFITQIQEEKKLLKAIPSDVDIINIHDNGFLWFFYIAKKKRKAKIVWQVNDLPHYFCVWENPKSENSLYYKLFRFLYRRMIRYVDRITVNVTKNKNRMRTFLGVDAEVFYCGVDQNNSLDRHYYRQKNTYNLLTTGVFFEKRNYESLVQVMNEINREGTDYHLDIIGSMERDRNYAQKITQMIESYNLDDKITIWGQVDENKYSELFNCADIFIFININQSWGLAVFEAMSCGLPVIVSNSVGAVELLEDEKNALIVDPVNIDNIKSKILSILASSDKYNQLSESAYSSVKDYTWDKLYSSRMLNLFMSLK